MSTLVTGGSGFIGRHVADRLHESGERVVTYDRGPPRTSLPPDIVRVRGELFDLRRLLATIADHGVQRIVHAAGMSDPLLSIGMPTTTVAANADGTVHLLEAARLAEFDGRIILLSSTSVHGHNDGLIDEDSPLSPRTPYAATKAFSDLLGDVFSRRFALDVISLRLSDAYGPGRTQPGAVQDILDAAMGRRPLHLPAGGDHPCHPIHIDDVARAVVAALTASPPHRGIYLVTGGERVSLGRVVALVRDRVPDADIRLGPGALPTFDRQGQISISAADRELGYRPRWGLARGVDDYCAWREACDPRDQGEGRLAA